MDEPVSRTTKTKLIYILGLVSVVATLPGGELPPPVPVHGVAPWNLTVSAGL